MAESRIIIIDDHPLYRSGVVRTLASEPDFKIVGEGGSADDALELCARAKPDIALLDISMPGGGIEAARAISRDYPDVAIAMLTASEEDDDILDAMGAGALGYVLKGVSAQELVSVVRTVAKGGSYVSPSLAGRLLMTMRQERNNEGKPDPLTTLNAREESILRLVAKGMSNKEAGLELGLQEKTIKHYMTAILQKLQVRNRTEAAVLARRHWEKGKA